MLRTNVFYDPNDPEEVELTDVKEDSEDELEENDDDNVPGLKDDDEEDDLYRRPVTSRSILTPSLHSTKNFLRKLLSFIEINHFVYIIQI